MVEPIGNRLLVKPADPEQKSKGGLLIKKVENEKQNSGVVIAVGDGPDVKKFKPGDTAIFFRYGPQDVLIDGVMHLIVHIDEILAKETK